MRWMLCLLASGCLPITTEEPPPSTCDPTNPNSVTSVVSGDGRVDVPTTSDVVVDLAYEEDDVGIVVRDSSGSVVPVRVFGDRRSYDVYPLVSWDGATDYELSVTHSCGTETFPFRTTSALPAVVPETLLGTWEIDAHSFSMNEYVVLSELAGPDLYPMAFQVLSVTPDTFDLRIAATSREDVGAGQGQDLCVPTLDLPGVPFDRNPSFAIEAPLPMRYKLGYDESVPLVVQDGWMAASFGERWSVRYGGIVDTTVLDPVFDTQGGDFADMCDAADVYGESCVACPDGGTTCLPTGGLQSLQMISVPELSLVARTEADIAADPLCP